MEFQISSETPVFFFFLEYPRQLIIIKATISLPLQANLTLEKGSLKNA